VLGTRLSEGTSFWNPALVPADGFIHVDIDPEVPGVAYPAATTFAVRADVGVFLGALLAHLPERAESTIVSRRPERAELGPDLGAVSGGGEDPDLLDERLGVGLEVVGLAVGQVADVGEAAVGERNEVLVLTEHAESAGCALAGAD